MTREQAINYLASSGMTDEQIAEIVTAIERTETHGDVISRQAAIDCEYQVKIINDIEYVMLSEVQMKMRKLPSAEPERKTGRWEMKHDPYGFFDEIPVCSECGCTTKMREVYNFCPNCGAKMEVRDEA